MRFPLRLALCGLLFMTDPIAARGEVPACPGFAEVSNSEVGINRFYALRAVAIMRAAIAGSLIASAVCGTF